MVDLEGRMVMPGIIDTHVHPMDAGRTELLECGFPFSLTMEQVLQRVQECAAAKPKSEWVRGGQWSAELLGTEQPPHKSLLDAIIPDQPVFLIDSTVHNRVGQFQGTGGAGHYARYAGSQRRHDCARRANRRAHRHFVG